MVQIAVEDLDQSLSFYCDILGLVVLKRQGPTVHLSANGKDDLIVLTGLARQGEIARSINLNHYAILLPTRYDLAHALHRLLITRYPLQGAYDHLISESLYLSDPEGNGIEIYVDRSRSEWPYDNGRLQISSDALDLDFLLAELGTGKIEWMGLDKETRIGHIHLQIPDLAQAQKFYHEIIGFDLIMQDGPGSLYLSAGGYHHHLGLNALKEYSEYPAPDRSAGLRAFEIALPGKNELTLVASRLQQHSIPFKKRANWLSLKDPFHNGLTITAR